MRVETRRPFVGSIALKVDIRRELRQTFVICADDIRKIVEILETKIGPAELAAVCRDNAERRFESIDELSSFENTNDQKILELEIKTHTKVEGEYFHARLRFLAEEQSVILSEGSKIKLHIDGENELAVALCRELEKKINILRPWYSIYAGLRRSHIFWTITLVIMGAALGLIQLLSNDSPEKQLSVSDTVAASFLVVFIVGVLALACSTALSKFILKLRQGCESRMAAMASAWFIEFRQR